MHKHSLKLLLALGCLGLSFGSVAQEKVEYKGTPQVKLDVCQGQVKVLSQQQNAKGVDLEVEVSIKGCEGPCIGSLEYSLVFLDASNTEVLWQMSDGWEWRPVTAPFTMKLHHDALPNGKLKEVRSMKLGRCSCSNFKQTDEKLTPNDFPPISLTPKP